MKRFLPFIVLFLSLAWFGTTLIVKPNPGAYDVQGFGKLPVLADGRVKPWDTIARTSLLQFHGSQIVQGQDNSDQHLSPVEWLLDVVYRPDKADTYRVFTIDNTELLSLIGKNDENLLIHYDKAYDRLMATIGAEDSRYRSFSYSEMTPYLKDIDAQAQIAGPIDAAARTPYQRAVIQLYENLVLYQKLEHTLQIPGADDFLGELLRFQQALPEGVEAVRAKQAGKTHNEDEAQAMIQLGQRYYELAQGTNILADPPGSTETDPNAWKTAGQGILMAFDTGSVDPSSLAYAGLGYSWRKQSSDQFNQLLTLFKSDLNNRFSSQVKHCAIESWFNGADLFASAQFFYLLAFLLGIISWLRWPEALGRTGFQLMALAWVIATAGIAARMWIGGRPPVTNLYSSALFIGWGSVGLCLILEKIYKNAIGTVAGGLIGFATLVIAHHLALGGDTLEMMRAVLDSNFWLSTHVVAVTTGYASTFLAGFLALIYIVRGVFTTSLDKDTAESISRMVYGIVCFATLFSFVGTVLGGIWADQSWGRFWGWDPKENGALIIVLWNALILHARWGGLIRQRGLMCLAVVGNIVTSWSWFGVNMLGVGLHSYGFTAAAFYSLSVFVVSQLVFVAIGNIPLAKWRSFKAA